MEHRRRERIELSENILCDGFTTKKENHLVKVPFVFEIKDMSYGGMKIKLDHLLLKHDRLAFQLTHASVHKRFTCEVQWSKIVRDGYVSGVQFLGLTREDVIFLYAYLKTISKRK